MSDNRCLCYGCMIGEDCRQEWPDEGVAEEARPIATAPRDGTEILAWIPDLDTRWSEERGRWRVVSWQPEGPRAWIIDEGSALAVMFPTHWMPLPARMEDKDA